MFCVLLLFLGTYTNYIAVVNLNIFGVKIIRHLLNMIHLKYDLQATAEDENFMDIFQNDL